MKKIHLFIVTILFFFVFISSSSASQTNIAPLNLLRLPMTNQATNFTCGVAAAQSVLGYFGDEYAESSLYRHLKPSQEDGTAYHKIANFLRSNGYSVEIFIGQKQGSGMTLKQLKSKIDNGIPVIVLIQAYAEKPRTDYTKDWDDGHYVVAIGYDEKNIYFMDPSSFGHYAFIPQKEFLVRWHDVDKQERLWNFGMAVTKKVAKKYDANKIDYLM
ncbi:MAG: C39 family peptidase [Gammaproteobacteria bacterium]|nr:C39 family peptidase [Gammaproteobacteria bacterium]